jgi:hypothetical protein
MQPRSLRRAAATAALSLLLLLNIPGPAGASHPQSVLGATARFDHEGDNEWWVEVLVDHSNHEGDVLQGVQALGADGQWRHLTYMGQFGEWGKWGTSPQATFRIGSTVQFRASVLDQQGNGDVFVTSCPFTHPAGVEQCGSPPPTFDASFTGVRGNEWWVQAHVATNGDPIVKVEVTLDGGKTWLPLDAQSWAPSAWAKSYHIPQGTVVRLRAYSGSGASDLSSCRQWIPPSGQDAQVVPCGDAGFQATFSSVAGNKYWQELRLSANKPVDTVLFTTDCKDPDAFGTARHRMEYRADWGKWVSNHATADGAKLTFYAYAVNPDSPTGFDRAQSGAYLWPGATPTSC